MPKSPGLARAPLAVKRSGKPSSDFLKNVFAISPRTSARLAVPFLHAFMTAVTTTCAATYVGAPKNSGFPPCERLYAVTILFDVEIGKNELYAACVGL